MQKESIKIEPKLSKSQFHEFLKFCYHLNRSLKKKGVSERAEFLLQEKSELNRKHKGKGFHSRTDIVFTENVIFDLLLQDWNLVINRKKISLELETPDEKDKKLSDEKTKTRRRHILDRDVQLKVPSVVEFVKGR